MSKYIKDCDVLKQYHLYPNEMSFEAANITDVITRTQEIISNNEDNVDKRKPKNESEKKKSKEVNVSD